MDLVDSGDYVLVNATDKAINGPFTRVDQSNPHDNLKKSALDLVVVSKELMKYVNKLEIDRNYNFTPGRNNNGTIKYPDHYAVLLEFNKIPVRNQDFKPANKYVTWDTKKREGWLQYFKATDDNEELAKIANLEVGDTNMLQRAIDKELERKKHKCFGKVKISKKSNESKNLEKLQQRKVELAHTNAEQDEIDKLDTEMSSVLKEIQHKKYMKDVKFLEDTAKSKGKTAAIFKLKEKMFGSKKTPLDQIAILDPDTNNLVFTPKEIKAASLKYCTKLLTNQEPREEYKE